jgi:hypothetical protein
MDLELSSALSCCRRRQRETAWDDDLIILPIDDPDSHGELARAPNPLSGEDDEPNYLDLEAMAEGLDGTVAEAPTFAPSILDALAGAAGAPIPNRDFNTPPPDCLAFYLPFHYYHPIWWGVYLLFEGVL